MASNKINMYCDIHVPHLIKVLKTNCLMGVPPLFLHMQKRSRITVTKLNFDLAEELTG